MDLHSGVEPRRKQLNGLTAPQERRSLRYWPAVLLLGRIKPTAELPELRGGTNWLVVVVPIEPSKMPSKIDPPGPICVKFFAYLPSCFGGWARSHLRVASAFFRGGIANKRLC